MEEVDPMPEVMYKSDSLPSLLNAEAFCDGPPHALFDYLRQADPVHGESDPINGVTAWSLTRFADLRAVSADPATFTIAYGLQYPTPRAYAASMGDSIMYNDPPRHTRLRSFGAKAFSPSVVSRFEGWIREICVAIVDNISRQETIDMVPAIAAELPGQVIASIMGVPDEDRRNLIGWATQIFGRLDPEVGLEAAMEGVATVRAYVIDLIAEKRRNPGVDMTSELLGATHSGEPITEGELIEMVLGLILAGFETTHTLIAQSLTLIAQDPAVRAQVDACPADKFTPVVEEMLRICCPVMHMARTATREVELHGKTIAEGDTIIMWYTAANRDPEMFENPHQFDASRGKRNHLAFGAGGPHFCLGNHLARLEVEILFQEMRKRNLRLDLAGEPLRSTGIFINALRSVPMKVSC